MHLNIDFFGDTIAYIPESDSLTAAKRFHLDYETAPPPSRVPSQLNVTKQDESEGLCASPLGPVSERASTGGATGKTTPAAFTACACVWGGVGEYSGIPTPPHLPTFPLLPTLHCSDIGS